MPLADVGGIVAKHINPGTGLYHLFNEISNLRTRRHITPDKGRRFVIGLDFFYHLLSSRLVQIRQEDMRAFPGKSFRNGPANPVGRAGHNSSFTSQSWHEADKNRFLA
jgi:hypothetical protein